VRSIKNKCIGSSRTCSNLLFADQAPPDNVPYNSDSEDDMDEDAYDLREVSSDVEVNPDEASLIAMTTMLGTLVPRSFLCFLSFDQLSPPSVGLKN